MGAPSEQMVHCTACGNEWEITFDLREDKERMCPACRSNSVRVVLSQ